MSDKLEEASGLLNQIYDKIDSEGCTQYEMGMYEVLTWLVEDTEKPEID